MSNLILHIETSSRICSVALSEGGELLAEINSNEPNIHSEMLTVYIQNLFEQTNNKINQLAAVSVSKGPGSFTGLRIGVSVAKGICYGADLPLIGVETAEAMCINLLNEHPVKAAGVVYEAGNGEAYFTFYDNSFHCLLPTRVGNFTEPEVELILNQYDSSELIVGESGPAKRINHWLDKYPVKTMDNYFPYARYQIKIANQKLKKHQTEDLASFEPYYLKDFIAKKGVKIKNILNS